MQKYIKKDDSILMAGCGNSRLSEDMFEDGYANLSNIDISRVARLSAPVVRSFVLRASAGCPRAPRRFCVDRTRSVALTGSGSLTRPSRV